MLKFGVPSGMTRIEFKRKCDEAGLYCFAIAKVEREGEHFRVTPTPKAKKCRHGLEEQDGEYV